MDVSRRQKAYILIRVQAGKEMEFYDELKELLNVGIDFVRGQYDFVVVAEGDASDVERVIFRIRRMPYIVGTETMTAFETFPWQELSGQLDYGHV